MRLLRLLLLTGTVLPALTTIQPADAAPGRIILAQGGPEERGPRGGGETPRGGPGPERPPQERPGPPAGRERPESRPDRATPPPRERPEPQAPRQAEPPQRERPPERRPEPPAPRPPAQERPDARPDRQEQRQEQRPDRQEQRSPDARPNRQERQPDREDGQPDRPAPDRNVGPGRQPRPDNDRPGTPPRQQGPALDRRAPDADRPNPPPGAPGRPDNQRDKRPEPGAGPGAEPGRPAPPNPAPGAPGRPDQRQDLQRQDLQRQNPQRQDVQPGDRPQPNAGPGAEPNRPAPPNMAPGVPGRPFQRQDVQPDGRPQPNAGPGAEPGRPIPPNLAPGIPGRPFQPGQAGGPGQVGSPGGRAGNGVISAPGQPGYVPGGFRQDDNVRSFDQVVRERREYNEDGRTYYREPGRIIVRDRDSYLIRHDENERFRALDPRGYRFVQQGADFYSYLDRPGGQQVVTVTADDGRMLRRYLRYRDGREVMLIDNSYAGPIRPIYEDVVVLPPPDIRIPRDRYIVDYAQADAGEVYEALTAPPVVPVERRYTLDQIRNSPDLRARMRAVDINAITFDTGSFTVTPEQAAKLSVIAAAMNRAIQANPREVFLIEGFTDAVGSAIDNLSLSDRRAQSVATVLTEQFRVPPENLTTQGYGEQYLKVNTQGPSRENRRVVVQRITPLLQQGEGQGQAAPPPPR
ncbi:OmpA family protein [Methylobacterium sp. J-088]|nr:OmpA family protein [Methylobacterium sp. J-088]